jgi:hypothetical protein
MGLMRDAARSTRGRIVIGAIVLLVLWKLALMLIAPTKVAAGLTPNARGQVNVRVTLTCAPERFHVLAFQPYGRVSGTQDRSIELRGVQVANLNAVARPYWVQRVDPLPVE